MKLKLMFDFYWAARGRYSNLESLLSCLFTIVGLHQYYHQWFCSLRPRMYHNAGFPRLLDKDMCIGYVDAGKLVPALHTSPHASFINE
jgi:hypothetical protein